MTTRLRHSARIALPLGLVGAIVGLGASPALAAAPTFHVTPGSSVTSDTTVTVTATDPSSTALGSRTLKLTMSGPDGSSASWSSASTAKTSSASVSSTGFNTANPSWSTKAAANGPYVFQANNGSSTSSTTVTLAIPPSDVTGFSGSASGSVASFTWAANTDNVPDFDGYTISDGTDAVPIKTSSACDAHTCAVSIDYGAGARGQTYSFSIVALRLRAPNSSGTVPSDKAATTSVTFPTAPSPQPSTDPGNSGGGSTGGTSGGGSTGGTTGGTTGGNTGGGNSGGTTGGGTTGGTTTGSSGGSHGRVLTGSHPGADLGRYLPTLSAGAAPNLPSVITEIKPIPQGTYKPTLAYHDQTVTSAERTASKKAVSAVGSDLVQVLNMAVIWKSLAAAALLLLITGHLRAWLDGIDTTE